MAYAKLYFENPHTGQVREAPVGFSWTVFFFGCFPPLFRSHWSGFAILFIAALITFGISNVIFAFIYNKMYLKSLISEGFRVKSGTVDLDFIQQKSDLVLPRVEDKIAA